MPAFPRAAIPEADPVEGLIIAPTAEICHPTFPPPDLHGYLTDDISLEEIAKVANLSPTAFCRLFKQRTNRHFVEYLNEVRISNACKFLLETSLNVSEIAFQCGYKTLSNFNKIFKKTTGLAPKEYRQKTEM